MTNRLEDLIPYLKAKCGWNRKVVRIKKKDMDSWKNWEEIMTRTEKAYNTEQNVLVTDYYNPITGHKIILIDYRKEPKGKPNEVCISYHAHVGIIASGALPGEFEQSPCKCPRCCHKK